MDFGEIRQVISKGVRYEIILISLLFGLAGNIIRGIRWGMLIDSLGERFRLSNVIYAVLGNYAVNFVLPRVGEMWRCGVVTKYDKIPFSKLFGTLLIDRIADAVAVGILSVVVLAFNFPFFRHFFAGHPSLTGGLPFNFGTVWIILFIVILIVAIRFAFTRLGHLSFVRKAKGVLEGILEGMKSIRLMEYKTRFLIQTILIWVCYFLYFYIAFYAFDFTRNLGIGPGLMAFIMSSIGVAVPIQGAIGPWHFMVIATLVVYGVNENDAAAFALVVHTIQSVWLILCGLFGIVALPVTNKNRERVK
jgi:uncharacterized protein (TIRG00374 family)